jgi:predicted nucleic acid-binding protein
MIVVDSSAMVEALVGSEADDDLLDALQGDVHAPHLLDVEVLSVLRGLTLGGS